MGLFDSITDIFTGQPAKDAAAKNTTLLQQNQTAGTTTLQGGQTGALGALTTAGGMYAPLAQKYGGATSLGLDALGVNGAAGNTRATDAFHAAPGYQYSVDQSLDGINRHAAAGGGPAIGGNTLAALSDRAGSMADQGYQTWLNNLNGYVSPELSAVSGQAGAEAAKAPVYTGTANSIANLGTNTTNGIANQNTQSANAEMAGSKNLWGLGMGLAQLGVGAATGGTSLLGGLGSLGGTSTGATAGAYGTGGGLGSGTMGGIRYPAY